MTVMSEMHNEKGVVPPSWDLADRMGKALRVSELTAATMAEYLDVHRNTISGYLHGHHVPQRSVLILWAMRTGVPLHWLLTGQQSAPHPVVPDEGLDAVRREGIEPPTR
jgi:transcriptional regulator with XRE-family HTH domain